MATTLAVDQAVQRLIQSVSRPSSESRVMTVTPSQNIDQRGNAASHAVFVSGKPPAGRSGRNGQPRYSDVGGLTTNRNLGEQYFFADNSMTPLSSFHRQNGRAKSNSVPINIGNRGSEEMNEIFPTQTTGSTVDVQRCMKNIIMSQVNIIKRQQLLLAAKEREIEELRRENHAVEFYFLYFFIFFSLFMFSFLYLMDFLNFS